MWTCTHTRMQHQQTLLCFATETSAYARGSCCFFDFVIGARTSRRSSITPGAGIAQSNARATGSNASRLGKHVQLRSPPRVVMLHHGCIHWYPFAVATFLLLPAGRTTKQSAPLGRRWEDRVDQWSVYHRRHPEFFDQQLIAPCVWGYVCLWLFIAMALYIQSGCGCVCRALVQGSTPIACLRSCPCIVRDPFSDLLHEWCPQLAKRFHVSP